MKIIILIFFLDGGMLKLKNLHNLLKTNSKPISKFPNILFIFLLILGTVIKISGTPAIIAGIQFIKTELG